MKKYIKCLTAACLAVCLAVCAGIFATACENVDKDHLVVTVKLENGDPAVGVGVQICATDGNELCLIAVPADGNGVATVDITACEGATKFSIHIENAPAGYAPEGADGEGKIYIDAAKDGYSTTITLKKGSADLPNPIQNIEIRLAGENGKQTVKPVIVEAGYYELRSINPFTVSGDGYSLPNGYFAVLMYLEPNAEFNVGTADELEFTCVLKAPSEMTTDGKTSPHVVAVGSAAVLKLDENESLKFVNPANQGNRSGSNAIVNGTNFKASVKDKTYTESFPLGTDREFTVSTANSAAGLVTLSFNSPENSVNVTVGESKQFCVGLMQNKISSSAAEPEYKLEWITEEQTYYVCFTVSDDGYYKISVVSEFENDKIIITQTGSDTLYPDVAESSSSAGKSYYAVYQLKAGQKYRAYVSSSGDYSGYEEGDKIAYIASVEKYTPAAN